MRGVYKQSENCRELSAELIPEGLPIKPIFGIEFYLCDDLYQHGLTDEEEAAIKQALPRDQHSEAIYQEEVRAGRRDRFHLTALAMDNDGLRNMYKLSSLAWTKGYWKRPRIDIKHLLQHTEGVIILSGCQSGVLNHYLLRGEPEKAIELAEQLQAKFGDRFYLEVMPHNMPDQVIANKGLLKISQALDIPIVATQDAHWINSEDAEIQEVMLCIQTGKTLAHPPDGNIKTGRFKFATDDYWFKTRLEMEATFNRFHGYFTPGQLKRSMDATLEIAERCKAELKIDRKKGMVPAIPLPPEFKSNPEEEEPTDEDEYRYLEDLCLTGWQDRLAPMIAAKASKKKLSYADVEKPYKARLIHELTAIKRQGCVRYFLVIWRMYNWVRAQGIERGPARGSAGGCLVSFLLYITDTDPIEYGLLFERFLSPERIDMPDVDCDFESAARESIIQYLRDTYGADKTCQIATIGTLKGKQCLDDICKVLSIPPWEVKEVKASIVERSSGDERASATIEDAFTDFDVGRKFNAKYPDVLRLAKKLEGQARNLGIHAAGVIVSPVVITDVAPLETRKIQENVKNSPSTVVSAFDMYGSAAVGLMKIDILGITNLDAIKSARWAIKERHGIDVDWDTIEMNDPKVLKNFTEHAYIGIFQFDTPAADKISEGVVFTSFEDVAAMIALDRPGTARSGLATEYLKRKQNPKARVSVHPLVDAICADTLGVIVYQEHVVRIFVEVAGFNPATADSLRKKIAKKWGDEAIGKERENFIKGAMAKGLTKELAEKLISQITFFGSYGFNKSHSIAYGLIGYRQMWLKTYYPTEFLWALMKHEKDSSEITRYMKECSRLGIPVVRPDVNTSQKGWTINDGGEIVASLEDLKGIGENTSKVIAEYRPYRSFIDFAARVPRKSVNRKHVEVLIKAGAMRHMVPNQKVALESVNRWWELTSKGKVDPVIDELLESHSAPDWNEDEFQIIASSVNPLSFGKHPLEPYTDFLDNTCPVPWVRMDDEHLFDHENGWINGTVLEVKYNQVGDFHTGPEPDDATKKRENWGARYANVNVEDISGKQNRMKVDWDIFDSYRPIVDQRRGAIIGAHVSLGKKFKNIRAHFLVDLAALRIKVLKGVPDAELTWEERMVLGKHPAAKYDAKLETLPSGRVRITGIITHVKHKLDKKGNQMGFFGIHYARGYTDGLCFASCWEKFKEFVTPGRIIRCVLNPERDSYILNDDVNPAVKVLE